MGTQRAVTLYHGTNAAAAAEVVACGEFRAVDPRRAARAVENRYGLERDSVWDSGFNSFSRGRESDPNVYFSGDRATAEQYARIGSETLFDALTAAWFVLNPDKAGRYHNPEQEPWVRAETAAHYEPVVLVCSVPWDTFATSFDEQQLAAAERAARDAPGPVGSYEWYEWAVGGEWESLTTVSLPAPVPAGIVVAAEPVGLSEPSVPGGVAF